MSQNHRDSNAGLTVFLCHAHDDKEIARDLCRRLRGDGFCPWLDEEQLLPGQDWEREIREAVRCCQTVLVCLSPNSVTKQGFVHKEITFALDVAEEKPDGTIYIIPARLRPCDVPGRLQRWQWVDLFEANGYQKLLRSLSLCSGLPGKSFPVEGVWDRGELRLRFKIIGQKAAYAFLGRTTSVSRAAFKQAREYVVSAIRAQFLSLPPLEDDELSIVVDEALTAGVEELKISQRAVHFQDGFDNPDANPA